MHLHKNCFLINLLGIGGSPAPSRTVSDAFTPVIGTAVEGSPGHAHMVVTWLTRDVIDPCGKIFRHFPHECFD